MSVANCFNVKIDRVAESWNMNGYQNGGKYIRHSFIRHIFKIKHLRIQNGEKKNTHTHRTKNLNLGQSPASVPGSFCMFLVALGYHWTLHGQGRHTENNYSTCKMGSQVRDFPKSETPQKVMLLMKD